MFWFLFLLLQLCSVDIFCFMKPDAPCKLHDVICMTDQGQDALITAVLGDTDYDIKPLDPMKQDLIMADLPGVKFTLTDSTVLGFKDTKITEFKMSKRKTLLMSMQFPRYEMIGKYAIDCYILATPIRTRGWYSINATNVKIQVDATYKIYEKNGLEYCILNGLKAKTNRHAFRLWDANFYKEDNKIDQPMLNYLEENPKFVTQSWHKKILMANLKKIFKNYNQVIVRYPFKDLIEI